MACTDDVGDFVEYPVVDFGGQLFNVDFLLIAKHAVKRLQFLFKFAGLLPVAKHQAGLNFLAGLANAGELIVKADEIAALEQLGTAAEAWR